MRHTPGPWKAEQLANEVEYNITGPEHVDTEDCQYVAVVYGGLAGSAEHANARLIAAAPDLLEVVRSVVMARDEADAAGDHYAELLTSVTDAARAAIARAEG